MTKLPIAASLFLTLAINASVTSTRAASTASAIAPVAQQASSSTTASTKKKSSKKHHASKREPTQKAPTPERISEIQSALARGGYYQGSPNGKWDSNTVSAMQKFQSENGLSSSGKIDAPSLQKLGLGSATAGVDAPKPIAPPGSAATTSSVSRPAATTTSASSVTPSASPSSTTPKPQRQ